MAQYFDEVKVSEKGMVKLIRNNGRDFIFPANRILDVCRIEEDSEFNIVELIADIIRKEVTKPKTTVLIKTKDGHLYVNVPFTEELYNRLNTAHTISENIAAKKYGTFS